ncbi:MAG: succinylglutamate desuccinylase/aspartoacylase family protein [Pyrinomonadaceae bacterium]|nr:succinylglutamate desuccinylase/aspartoacylase family protein [Pyrinomonadaceae bacterium]
MNQIKQPEIGEILTKDASSHLLGAFCGGSSLRTLIVLGSVHGNETSGTRAIERIVPKLENIKEKLNGRVFLIAGNTRALKAEKRFIDADLNRHFTEQRLRDSLPDSPVAPKCSEDLEMRELLEIFNAVLSSAREEVFVLDLHSTSAEGAPFGTVGDTLRNREFTLKFPITFLLGIEEQLDGTILEYLNNRGAVTLGFEAGQHAAKSSIDNHEALIWLALKNSEVLPEISKVDVSEYRKILKASTGDRKVLEIRYRHAIKPEDEFSMLPGFENFQPVERGQLLANQKSGPVTAPESGVIMMPLYQKQGEDGFFIAREISRFWLGVSRILRKLNVADLIHLLPGVNRVEGEFGTFEVNTRVARFFPLQIFHLLGFRKRRWHGTKLIVTRRNFDTVSPFQNEIFVNK